MVALYITTDSFKLEITARIKSITLKTNRRAVFPSKRWDGSGALLSEVLALQKEKSVIWATVTGETGRRQGVYYMRFQFSLQFILRHMYLRGSGYWD